MKNSICITGLLSQYTENLTKEVSIALGTNFASLSSMIEFDLVDVSETINVCGIDYYKGIVSKKLKELSSFDNTTIYANYYMLQYDVCRNIVKNDLLTIYIDVGEKLYNKKLQDENLTELEMKLEKGAYKVRNKYFSKNADIVIKAKDKTQAQIIENIIKTVFKYYSKEVKKNEARKKSSK
ncbi:MAG: hypothetical protein E7361_02330 [Clostridiales bacterium]|nr:hypothetical protein [Clostridiales bacterium]